MSGVRCQVSGVRCQVSGVRCQVSENTARRNGEHQQSAVLIACQGWFHEQVGGVVVWPHWYVVLGAFRKMAGKDLRAPACCKIQAR